MRETKISLNVKDIQHRLLKAVHVSVESSYKFLQSHPKISCVLFIFFILYAFLSYIYTFLNYISPFLICAAIFIKIFWSSEQTQLRYVKRDEEKKVEQQQQKRVEFEFEGEVAQDETKFPKILHNIGKRELLYKYPSQNATSRRRNFREKKWDVYGGLEEKAKNLSAVFQNEFTKKSTFEKGESSLYYGLSGKRVNVPKRQTTLRSEPSMIDLVEIDEGDETEKLGEYVESEEEDEEDPREEEEEERNKAIEWTEDDQKNLMDLGQSEMERNKRLESLIARRREKKLLKLQLENGLIDKKSMTPNLMAPLVIKRDNPNIDGDLEMPGSAPSFMPRSPYDFPYEPFEEKPNLTEDGFLQEYHKEMPFCRHESFISLGNISSSEASDRLAYSRFRKSPDKGNHDWLIDQLMYNEGTGIGIQQSNPLTKGEESTHEDDGKCKTNIDDMKVEKEETSHETKSISDETNKPNLIPNFTNVERFSKINLPLPTRNTTTTSTSNTMKEFMYDHIPSPIDKRQETMFLNDRRFCHTPTYSIASDLQVEVSEIGSPTSTVDNDDHNNDTNSSTDRDSVLYDGDIDRDVSSGSEDLWGASFHGVRSEEDIIKDVVSPISLRQIDEENVADISSHSSRSDLHHDTPTSALNVDDVNPFGSMNYSVGETEPPQYSNSSSMDQLPHEIHSETQQKWCNISENLTNESEVINDVNNTTNTEQNNIENSISNEDPGPSTSVTRQESIDETSIYSVTSSPRSVLPDKTTTDDVSSSAAFNQEMDTDAEQSNIGETAQETFNGETSPPETMQQNIQPLMDDINNESHNVDFNHSLEQTNPIENSIEESNIFGNMDGGEICREKEPDKLNNEENSEDNSTNQTNQEGTSESTIQINEMTTTKDVDDKVPLVEEDKNEIPASGNINIHEDLPHVPNKESNEGHVEDS